MKLVVTTLILAVAFGSVWVPAILGQNEEPAEEEQAEQAESEQVTERERRSGLQHRRSAKPGIIGRVPGKRPITSA